MPRWKTKGSRKIAESTLFVMKEDEVVMPGGTEKRYTVIDFPDFAGVLPVYRDQFVMVRNYRYPVDQHVIEIPAGLIDPGEEPLETARRELEEETGFLLKDPVELCTYNPVASLNVQVAHLYMGRGERGGKKKLDDGEDMEVCLMDIREAYDMLERGELKHPHTMIALFFARPILQDEGLL